MINNNFSKPEQYKVFRIPKKSGGFRQIEAPNEELKATQRKLLSNLKGLHYISPFCHSFRSSKNVVSNAIGHVGAKYVLHIDAKNFFPSITWRKFWAIGGLKYNDIVKKDDLQKAFCMFDNELEPRLPQGAPTSPWLSNVYLARFDTLIARYLTYLSVSVVDGNPTSISEYNYSRYADDITISGPDPKRLWALFFMMEKRLDKKYGITLNRKKTRMMGPGQRKIVCGIVVNEKHHPRRRWRKNLRAEIHNQVVNGQPLKASTLGKIAYLNMCRNTDGKSSSQEIFSTRMSKVLEQL